MKTYAIIPAGGSGSRTGLKVPKQYVKIRGKEIILYTLQNFQKNKTVDEIIISAEPEYFRHIDRLAKNYKLSKVTGCVKGGKERQDSVYSALQTINAGREDLIIVHDAARPILHQSILNQAIITARKKGNAVVCIKARDTLLSPGLNEYIYPERGNIFYVQTPQIYTFGVLMKAMEMAFRNNFIGTDESVIVSAIGEKLHLVEGSFFNFKVTTREDMLFLRKLLK